MDEVTTIAECYIKREESNMEKRFRDAKEKIGVKKEGFRHMKDYPKFGLRDRTTMRPSRRPFVKEAECTPSTPDGRIS